ncbi:MAG: Gldg family protein [Gemmatimonadota bacterium]|jgi:ABC-2 type transport system permease protein
MKNIRIVARRELRGYFDQATAYILLIAFLALGLFLLFRAIYAQQLATLRPFFDLLPWLFAVFVPAITMRSLAEERRGRTLEWLMAQPLTESDVLLGKFLGDWSFVLIGLAATLPTALGVLLASEADAGIMVGQYVGAALLAAQMVAIGLWCSAVTRNQITAFILGAGISFVLILIGLPVVQIGLPPVLAGMFARLSVLGHFNNVARGVIDLRDVVYFLSVTALFLMLAGTAVGGERLSHARGAWRRLRLGTAAVAVLVVFINLLGGYIRGRLDLTRDRLYTLAPGSRQILGNLDDVVNLKLFVSRDLPPEVQLELRDVRDLVADLRRASDGRLHVEERNPDKDPAVADEARSLGIQQIEVNVLRNDEYQVRRGWFGIALTYADQRKAFPVIDRTDDLEYRLVAAISTMTATRKPRITFVTGFQAKGPWQYQAFQQTALGDRYDVRTTALDSTATLSKDSTDVVALIAPEQPLDSAAVRKLDGWVAGGGPLLLLLEPITINPQAPMAMGVRTGLDDFLQRHGVQLRTGMVYDLQSHANVTSRGNGFFAVVRPYPLWPVALPASPSAMTRSLNNLSLAWSGALDIVDTAAVQPLWQTTDQAGLLPPEGPIDPAMFHDIPPDSTAPEIVAVAIDPEAGATGTDGAVDPGRMVVVADANFLEDQFVNANPQNVLFAANAIDWLAQDDALIRIRSKNRAPPALTFASDFGSKALKWGNLVGIPVLLALFGLLRIGGRRRRAIRKWEETGERA